MAVMVPSEIRIHEIADSAWWRLAAVSGGDLGVQHVLAMPTSASRL
jgi:hypothetical protein